MAKLVLIIGGAGFIGSHTADELAKKGYKIRILDMLSPKTHGEDWPEYLDPSFEKVKGDVRDREILEKALEGVDYVYHLAAQMDLMPIYSTFFDVNVTSNALLYEIIVAKKLAIKKVIVASSQFVYGEGRWKCKKDGDVFPGPRSALQLDQNKWDPVCPKCGGKINPTANQEHYQDPPNQYAISKYTQELFSLKIGKLQNIPSVAMRYSIVHGPRQSLKNAYSGALRTFTMKIINGETLATFEDNLSTRDFVSIHDVARANVLVLENEKADYQVFNVGGGKGYTVNELAKMIGKYLKKQVEFAEKVEYRLGDTRHAVSDISKLKKLGWKREVTEEETVKEYLDWVKEQGFDISYLHEAEKKDERSRGGEGDMISAAIVTFNEARKLEDCLKSIEGFVDEIIIVDLGSSDELDLVQKKFKSVKKIKHERVIYVELVRQFSIDHCNNDWVLVLDPDERVSKDLAKELKRISDDESFKAVAVNIPTKNIFFGKWISHTNFWPDRHLRFFRKGKVKWGKKIHSYPKVEGEIYDLAGKEELGLIHYGYHSYGQFIQKQNRYAVIEAQNKLSEGKHFSFMQLFWMPMREFLARYLKHQGYLDGFNGIFLVGVLMYYQVMVQLNMIRYAKNFKSF